MSEMMYGDYFDEQGNHRNYPTHEKLNPSLANNTHSSPLSLIIPLILVGGLVYLLLKK